MSASTQKSQNQQDSKTSPKPHKNASAEYFGALDGFRGLLACVVAIYHTIWLSNINSSPFLNNGQVLVDLFFVFSGFLMFFLYDGRLGSLSQGSDFIRRRIARIYPLHFVMLIVFVLFQALRVLSHYFGLSVVEPGEILPYQIGASETLGSFFANLTLTHSMGILDSLSYNAPAWTVSVEFWAYFVFLGMMWLCPPRKMLHFVIMGLGVAVIYAFLSTLKPNMDFHYDLGFWRCLGGFFSGVLVARLYRSIPQNVRNGDVSLWGSALEVFTLVALVSFVLLCTGKLQFFLAPFAILFVFTFAIGRGFISKMMSIKPMLHLGKISYSIYLVHMVISAFFAIFAERLMPGLAGPDWNVTGLGGDLLLIPYLLVVVVLSHFTYHYIEVPGQKAIMVYRVPQRLKRLFGKGKVDGAA